jgi:tetratricopeptide (TPR) repeat protein
LTGSLGKKYNEDAKLFALKMSAVFMKLRRCAFISVYLFCYALFPLAASHDVAHMRPRLAILCFENNTGDENLAYLSCGISEWIIADLNQSKYINVLPTDSKIGYIVNGNYAIENDKFKISVMMRDYNTGEIIKKTKVECTDLAEIPLFVDNLTPIIKAWMGLTEDQINNDFDRKVGQITTHSQEAFRYFLDGQNFLLQGKEKEAVSSYKKALEIDPQFALARWKMGMAFRPQSIFSYAKKNDALLKAMELPERLSERAFLRLKGDYNSMTRYRYDEALRVYEKLLALYPDDYEGHFDLGLLYFDIEDWKKAASQFWIVIEAGENRPAPYLNLALANMNPGLYDEAQKVLESYLNSIGDNVNIYLSLALVHRFRGEYDSAHRVVDKAISLYPSDASCYANKGDIYLYSGDLVRAEEEYQKLLKHEKTEFKDMGLYRLAQMYLLLGRFEESRALSKQATERAQLRGDKGAMRDKLSFSASLDSLTGHPHDAIEKLDALWKTSLEDEELEWQRFIVYRKGIVHAEMSQLQEALSEAKELEGLIAQGLDKKKKRLYLHLMGVIELKRKNYQKAIEYLEESLPMICVRSRLNIAVADSLASAYSGKGDLEKARREYERIATFPRGRQFYGDIYARSIYHLGRIYEDEGQKDKAVENYTLFLDHWKDADPDVPEIEEARRSLKILKEINGVIPEVQPSVVFISMGGNKVSI